LFEVCWLSYVKILHESGMFVNYRSIS